MFKTYWNLESVGPEPSPCALAIGNFDGLHLGHRRILEKTKEGARRIGGEAVVLTFDPHPTTVVAPERAPDLLMLTAERLRRFEECGIDAGVVLPFTEQIARLGPEEFVEQILVKKLNVRSVVVGEGFRFGHRQSGDTQTLIDAGSRHGFEVVTVQPVLLGGRPVSSSRVRTLVRQGSVSQARRLLAKPFSMRGEIVSGHGIGSRQTVPTLNLSPETKLLPAQGVYVTCTSDLESGRRWQSVTNVGSRPTFNGTDQTVETYLLEELAGRSPARIELAFLHRIRDEQRFETPEELRRQILKDVEQAKQYFRRLGAARTTSHGAASLPGVHSDALQSSP